MALTEPTVVTVRPVVSWGVVTAVVLARRAVPPFSVATAVTHGHVVPLRCCNPAHHYVMVVAGNVAGNLPQVQETTAIATGAS